MEPINTRHFEAGETKNVLDDHIDRHADAYLLTYPEVMEFSPFERSGTFKYYIGMIWTNDCVKPDEKQFRLRGSQKIANQAIVDIDVSLIPDYQSFFPGQIIAFLAQPHETDKLRLTKILDPVKIAPELERPLNGDRRIKLFIAAGPFMQTDILDWTLLDSFISTVKLNEATHIILLGPLVDLENTKLCVDPYDPWKRIYDKLVEGLHNLKCHVYIVPSIRDYLTSKLESNYFYPSSKLNFKYFQKKIDNGVKCRIESVNDPSQIDLGGLLVDVTSAEILFQMNKCTLHVNKTETNPFNSIYRHMITHGIYPLYPSAPDLPVDYVKLAKFNQLDRPASHIIVVPTRFAPSVTEIEDRLFASVPKCSVKKQAIYVEIEPEFECKIEPIDDPRNGVKQENGVNGNSIKEENGEDKKEIEVAGDVEMKKEEVNEVTVVSSQGDEIYCKSEFSRSKWRIVTLK